MTRWLVLSFLISLPAWAYRCEPGEGATISTNGVQFAMNYGMQGWSVRIVSEKPVEVAFGPGYRLLLDGRTIRDCGQQVLADATLVSGGKESRRYVQTNGRGEFTIPFDYFGTNAPLNGETWPFEIAGVWSGKIEWRKPDAFALKLIRKQMIRNAWRRYKDDRTEMLVYWKLRGVDPEFYETRIVPLTAADAPYETTDGKLKDLDRLEETSLLDEPGKAFEDLFARIPVWLDFLRHVDEARHEYLLDQLVGPGPQLRKVVSPGETLAVKDFLPTDLIGEHGKIPATSNFKVPENAAPGLYTGGGLTLRVLPFPLPPAKTYYDLDRDFPVDAEMRAGTPSRLAAIARHRMGELILAGGDPCVTDRRRFSWLAYKAEYDGATGAELTDIRYATLLKMRAAQALAGDRPAGRLLAKTALHWLEMTDGNSANLDTMRLEMVRFIGKLSELGETQQ
ncbi:MAG: hypothetical protein PCFJNLEI_00058 [Verrucomicrobiae bacterium]|nr:hypothetical protein [Verrucomicrobiae bacterium]